MDTSEVTYEQMISFDDLVHIYLYVLHSLIKKEKQIKFHIRTIKNLGLYGLNSEELWERLSRDFPVMYASIKETNQIVDRNTMKNRPLTFFEYLVSINKESAYEYLNKAIACKNSYRIVRIFCDMKGRLTRNVFSSSLFEAPREIIMNEYTLSNHINELTELTEIEAFYAQEFDCYRENKIIDLRQIHNLKHLIFDHMISFRIKKHIRVRTNNNIVSLRISDSYLGSLTMCVYFPNIVSVVLEKALIETINFSYCKHLKSIIISDSSNFTIKATNMISLEKLHIIRSSPKMKIMVLFNVPKLKELNINRESDDRNIDVLLFIKNNRKILDKLTHCTIDDWEYK